ncbi:unnamed protein product [Cyclocybe aegerita]|uniref:RING-type domain-containing protein n=1 Tax=Cyclocybe aegerita TaxID=1973307 RepID=A0A8S0W7D6_CYCAE|nr:unnamed protein product [Cyclocybe aegerita]
MYPQEHIIHIQSGLLRMRRQLKALRKRNEVLKTELADARKSEMTSRRYRSRRNSDSDDDIDLTSIRIKGLEETVKDRKSGLRETNREGVCDSHLLYTCRSTRVSVQMKSEQLNDELRDLKSSRKANGNDEDGQTTDPGFRMRKVSILGLLFHWYYLSDHFQLLRKFSDLMLECSHIICHECLPQISKGADETVKCPQCREPSQRDALELIHMTEENRWDALLEIAQDWTAFDNRGELETSKEEAEEEFITDGDGTSECSSEAGHSTNHAEDAAPDGGPETANNNDSSGPATTPHRSFSASPRKEKRKILEGLVDRRTRKRQK